MKFFLMLGGFMLMGCSTSLEAYKSKKPELHLDQFFNGELKAWGVVMSRSGTVTRRFTATLQGEWNGVNGVLKEDFVFDNQETQKRQWNLKKVGENQFEGTANDVEGVGRGQTSGFAMNWKYVLKIPVDGTTYNIPFDDSMFLVDQKSVINRAVMKKFGFRVGEIIIFIQKI
jgi:hypothetical protein